ncbi:carbohydrate-binding protein [Streptomyces sp. RY43-2]|uniref:Carbohydrate-binding protein n=1 Tax=Streptomyces macrolidinus TaxID=2952607 RepID=A0ABT0ZK69_9ACTN|nr:carbohydrate-binding protein [Streptomyces macrolidinus]MCN9243994.1 carbohydrate-binding protein [Streptomyces macrolidinus]
MTAGDNGASTPEDDDPFGYLYADGQANGAQPPTGGYGYPGSVNRVRAVGQRQYGQPQQPPAGAYGQPPQQAYGQPNAHYAAPETMPGGAPTRQTPMGPGGGAGGRGRGPNTKVLLIGAVAVVAAVVIGISVAMIGGDSKDDEADNRPTVTETTEQATEPSEPTTTKHPPKSADLPKTDAKALKLDGGAAAASDVKGARSEDGSYVTLNQAGAALTWSVDVPTTGKYTLYSNYGVPGTDGNATLSVNGTPQTKPLELKNFAQAPEGDWEKGWTNRYNWIELNKGTNTIRISCEQGNQCNANFDQLWLAEGWKQ